MSIQDQAAKQLPHRVQISIVGMDRYPMTEAAHQWCVDNCQGEFRIHVPDTTWRSGTPGWTVPFSFASDRDAALFKLFWT